MKYDIKLSPFQAIAGLIALGLLLCTGAKSDDTATKEEFFAPVIEKLLAKGGDSAFVYFHVNHKNTSFDDSFVKINVTGYLKKHDYSHNYSAYSVKKTKTFLREYEQILVKAERKYGVPKEVITSVIWVETKFGKFLGRNHVPSVYLSTAMANQEEFIKLNKEELHENFEGSEEETKKLEKKIESRAERKSEWALGELLALQKIHEDTLLTITNLEGSWAGAFGLSQFLPSSYVRWAVDGNDDGRIDLFDMEDAFFSVANYLKSNGWGSTRKAKRKAVYHYNNSSDYVDAVFELASRITDDEENIPETVVETDYKTPLRFQLRTMPER